MVMLASLIDWTIPLGDLIVGGGTILLALFTWRLARSTAASVDALDRPFLLATPDTRGAFHLQALTPEDEGTDAIWAFSVSVRNLGSGPAILDELHLYSRLGRTSLLQEGWDIDRPVLPKEEDFRIGIPLRIAADTAEFSPFLLELLYRSASENRYVTVHEMEQTGNMGARRTKFNRKLTSPTRDRFQALRRSLRHR